MQASQNGTKTVIQNDKFLLKLTWQDQTCWRAWNTV